VAVNAVDRVRRLPGAAGEVNTLLASIEFQKGRSGPARRLLKAVIADELPHQAVTTAIDAWLLDAVLTADSGEMELTRPAVDAALELAVPLGALRGFVAAGPALRDILLHDLGRFGVQEHFVLAVIAAVGPATRMVQPLSPREREVLAELPTMRTVEEIAGSLYISASTVKTHLRSIYAKLGVGTRRDAVAAARRHGLT
ncbi:LuxR C-terminal-related transcriptional regulator, partial [Actinoplanes sp. NPDC051633]|uniref:helix-turn-helix transcriptional regulator n=1 Tax=Actinoplanes sp. NPDC051633 TaxID=3155670 RepID=UPI003433AD24